MTLTYAPSKLRLERIRLGVSLSRMAYETDINISLLSLIERGQTERPDIERRMRQYLARIEKKAAR